jgi:hypothetical protein
MTWICNQRTKLHLALLAELSTAQIYLHSHLKLSAHNLHRVARLEDSFASDSVPCSRVSVVIFVFYKTNNVTEANLYCTD